MLKLKSINAASHIAEAAGFNNRNLSTHPASPLHAVVATLEGVGEIRSETQLIMNSGNINSVAGSHGTLNNRAIKDAARILNHAVRQVKNHINPICREIVDGIEQGYAENSAFNVSSMGSIKLVEMPDLFLDPMFMDLVDDFSGYNGSLESTYGSLSELDNVFNDAECKELLLTGSSIIDEKVSRYLSDDGEYHPPDIEGANSHPLESNVRDFLFLNGVLTGKIEKSNVLLNDSGILRDLTVLKALIGKRISTIISKYMRAYKGGDIFVTINYLVPKGHNSVLVHGKAYRKWVQDGAGSPEALLGLSLSLEKGNINMEHERAVMENPARYVGIYENKRKFKEALSKVELVESTVQAVKYGISAIIRNDEDLTDAERISLQTKLTQACEKYTFNGTVDTLVYVRQVVCAVFTEGETVEQLLAFVDAEMLSMDTPDQRTAIYMGTIKLVSLWISNQITVIK